MHTLKLKYLFLFVAVFFLKNTFAQEKTIINLLNSNSVEYNKRLNREVQRLIGNVIFKLDSTYLYCDSAYHYIEIERIDAFSNVHIKQGDTLDIYGDTLIFNGVTNIAELMNNVQMIDKEMILTTDNLKYNINTEIAEYWDGGKIVDTRNQLTSDIGKYFSANKEFFFKDDVVFTNPNYIMNSDTLKYNTETEIAYFFGPTTIESEDNFIYCENGWSDSQKDISQFNKNAYFINKEDGRRLEGDSLYYDRIRGFGKAFNNVVITDTVQDILISGDFGKYTEETQVSFVTGQALMTQIEDYDSLFLHADTLLAINDSIDTNRIIFAYHKVKFYKTDFQGMCDSLVYRMSDSTINMFYAPVLWSEEHQLSADTVRIKTGENEIKQIFLSNVSFIISKDDTAKFNQIKGDNITGYFNNNELTRIFVKNKSQTVYYLREDNGHLIGVNTSVSKNVEIFLEDSDISKIKYLSDPEAIMYPADLLPKEKRYLKDFKWMEEHRPKSKADVFKWKQPIEESKRSRRQQ